MQAPTGSIQPSIEVPLDGLATGGFRFPITAIDQETGVCAVALIHEDVPFWDLVKYQSADWLAWLFAVTAVCVAWRIWRVARKPQAKGRLVCRRCAYDLTPVGANPVTGTCPECGLQTSKHRPIIGSSRLRRSVLSLAVLTVVGGALWLSVVFTLEPVRPVRMTRLWPPVISPYLPLWLQRVHRAPPVSTSERVEVWAGSSGRKLLTHAVDPHGFPTNQVRNLRILGGGTLLGITLESTTVRQELVRVSDGAVVWSREYGRGASDVRAAGFAGANDDGSHIYTWRHVRHEAGATSVVLDRVNAQTGAAENVGAVDLPSDPDMWGAVSAVAAEQEGTLVWAALVHDRTGFTVVWDGGSLVSTKPGFVSNAGISVGPDGVATVDVLDAGPPPQRVWTARLGQSSGSYATTRSLVGSGGTVAVMDGDGSPLYTLWANGATAMRAVREDPRPRWVSAVCARQSKRLGLPDSIIPSSFKGSFVVWKLPPDSPPAPATPDTVAP